MKILRWLLVVPSIGAGYLLAVLIAMASIEVLTRLCPPEQIVSGACMASWFSSAMQISLGLAATIGATAFVGLPAVVSPIRKLEIALLALFIGVCIVAYGLSQVGMSFLPEAAGAAIGGGLACTYVRRWLRSNSL